jgi:hypothetical protein
VRFCIISPPFGGGARGGVSLPIKQAKKPHNQNIDYFGILYIIYINRLKEAVLI